MSPRAAGRFLALEGIDGSGKTTQVAALAEWLPTSGLMPPGAELVVTREPGGTALGQALRQLLLHPPGDAAPVSTAELLLYAADRAQHVRQVIAPALAAGHWVLTDRFSGSTAAYQGYGRGLPMHQIQQLEEIATAGLYPDLTIWLHLPANDSHRRRDHLAADRIESAGDDFMKWVCSGFCFLAAEREWVRIDASLAPERVSADIKTVLLGPLWPGSFIRRLGQN
jgi:dTMP kinase